MAAHAAVGQVRKYTGEPYAVHPIAVAGLVRTYVPKASEEMLIAALLHDVVEDTQVTLELIAAQFGLLVASYVDQLTDVSKPEDGNRAVRKAVDKWHTAQASPAAKTIKLADLIHNTASIRTYDPEFAKVYLVEKRALLEVLTEGDPTLYRMAVEAAQ
jgi:Guanosine polyphosphate pyrophosphohydrolases/synthetases